jgi:hypothetical protein
MTSIGFVILSHTQPKMLKRLVARLNQAFDHPRIVCHHDMHQFKLDCSEFSQNVEFVADPVRTGWGNISVLQAFLLGLRTLYSRNEPDWFMNLSTSDYPIKTGDEIIGELKDSTYDAYMNHRLLSYENIPNLPQEHDAVQAFNRPSWSKVGYDRYLARVIRYPSINKKGKRITRRIYLRHPMFAPSSPFDESFRCYGGDTWFTALSKCAEALIADTAKSKALREYYSNREVPDESYYQTIVCNQPGVKICNDNRRYANWMAGGSHPKFLGVEDLPALEASTCHFARKFNEKSEPALDELDRKLGLGLSSLSATA